jgi:hypothetical protein
MEIAVAAFMALLGLIAIIGSLRVGIGWGAEGPQAGFFPFYVGLFVILSCGVNVVSLLRTADDHRTFAEWSQLRQVFSVVVPTAIYVAVIPFIGIYVSSALLIAFFMIFFGNYRWHIAIPIAIAVPVLVFFMFEIWFLVPLPKGPLERLLYY